MSESYQPVPETIGFAKESFRVRALGQAGLDAEEDWSRLRRMGDAASAAQKTANARTDRERGR